VDRFNLDFDIPVILAPWQLTGEGFILVYQFSRTFIRHNDFLPAGLADNFVGGPSVVMLLNYHTSNAGPYQELLFIPGLFSYRRRWVSSITRIYVSTQVSVVNGRCNWSIPKELADFDWRQGEHRQEQVTVSHNGHPFAHFTLQAVGPAARASSRLIPAGWRTLWQPGDNGPLLMRPQGAGWVRLAKCVETSIDPAYFPNLSRGRLLAALKATHFKLAFPAAEIKQGVSR
jgi:hypothetical protein